MQLHIILSDEDRQRLGAPDPLVYDRGVFRVSEATALYKVAGMTRKDMHEAYDAGNPEGRKAITWLALRRAGVDARYSELDFDLLRWALVDPNPKPAEAAADAGAEDPDGEGNSGALPSEGPTPQS
ncbi:hypothetical protein ACIBBG_31980 [Micromonospora chersina]|uniref:hypothetical protein n=1 Tax=Micromonospora chersina TaxID=47854 RepID=UPI003799756C